VRGGVGVSASFSSYHSSRFSDFRIFFSFSGIDGLGKKL
jgi:hypothetical protein